MCVGCGMCVWGVYVMFHATLTHTTIFVGFLIPTPTNTPHPPIHHTHQYTTPTNTPHPAPSPSTFPQHLPPPSTHIPITCNLWLQIHRQRWRLDIFRNIDNLCQPWYTQRHILCRHARKVKRIERHLGRRLPNRLCSNRPHHLPRKCNCQVKSRLNFTHNHIKCPRRQLVLPQHPLGGECGP